MKKKGLGILGFFGVKSEIYNGFVNRLTPERNKVTTGIPQEVKLAGCKFNFESTAVADQYNLN